MTNVENVWEIFNNYMGSELWIVLFAAAFLIVFCFAGKGQKLNILLAAGLSVLIVFNDFVFRYYGKTVEKATFYRFFWMLPVTFVIAYAAARMIRFIPWTSIKALFLAVVLMTAAFAGFSGTQKYDFKLPESENMLDLEIEELSEKIRETGTMSLQEPPRILMPIEVQLEYRTYDAFAVAVVGRDVYMEYSLGGNSKSAAKKQDDETILSTLVNGYGIPEAQTVKKALKAKKTDFVIASSIPGVAETFEAAGCERFGETENYVLLRCS